MAEEKYTAEEQREANEALKPRIGRAVAAWSFVESSLATWFERLTKMHPLVAHRTFYSVTGFDARARMLRAAIDTVPTDPDISKYLTAVANKARQYTLVSSYRLRFAANLIFVYRILRPLFTGLPLNSGP